MRSFLGVLCCGGRGTRLGKITNFVSKALVPVWDRPTFAYGLAQLQASRHISEILILTNHDNDKVLQSVGVSTLIQDDAVVTDMFSGLAFIRSATGDDRPAVLMPCDNISSIQVDDTIETFQSELSDLTINLRHIEDPSILSQIGVYEPETREMTYRPPDRKTGYGVLAPYVVRPGIDLSGGDEEVINRHVVSWRIYDGFWFDIGTPAELFAASNFLRTRSLDSTSFSAADE